MPDLPPPSDEPPAPSHASQPPRAALGEAALHGPAGYWVRTLAPHTEAHPAALLLQFLAAFGNAVGPALHCLVGETRHRLNLFVVLVGESGKARKGTSWSYVERLFAEVDQPWTTTRIFTAPLAGGSLGHALRDQQPPTDRRLLVVSEEFASVLHTLKRPTSNLSTLLRYAWDDGNLHILEGRRAVHATNTHISLIAHITPRELALHLNPADAHNGFANRCLWTHVHRTQCLPNGGSLNQEILTSIAQDLRRVLDWAAATNNLLIRRDKPAQALWEERYPTLSQARSGLFGAATNRAEAQALRLSAIYAALGTSSVITVAHLEAALAVWDYCSASALDLFGTSTGDPIADRIKQAIDAADEGLSRKAILGLFHGHVSSGRIQAALEQLMSLGVLAHQCKPGAGRHANVWSAVSPVEGLANPTP